MPDHSVVLSRHRETTRFDFSDNFNVAVPFIDRHLEAGRGDKVAIRTLEGAAVTYAWLAEEVARWGNVLRQLKVAPGERQLMVVPDVPGFFYLFWGAIKAGVVPVPLNTLLRAKDYRYMIEDSSAAVLVYAAACGDEVVAALREADHRPAQVLELRAVAELAAGADPELSPHPATAGGDCFWLYSSGSTGFPKGAVHSHRDMVVSSQCYGTEVLGITQQDVCFSAAKLFFAYGLGNAMTFPLWAGASCVLASGRPTPELTFELIEGFRPTFYFGVPTLYAAQLAALETAEVDFSSLRGCVSAGEALPADLFRRWRERTGLSILDGIGSTEALHIFISNTAEHCRPGTSGRTVPGYQARIVDEQRSDVPAGTSGRLLVRGGSIASRYWNQPEKTADTMLPGGWLDTGDTYHQDEQGDFVYEGRSDDMMKVGGIWTSPVEIEAALIEHPEVLEAAVVARADDNELIKPEAFIVRRPGSEKPPRVLEQELRAHVKSLLAPYKYPRWWQFVDQLPKTATGKIQRFRLRRPAGG